MMKESIPKLPNGMIRLMIASINEVKVAAPGFRTMPIAITCHIMYIPPHTAPPGMLRGSVTTETIGRRICFVPKSKAAKTAMVTRSTVAIFASPRLGASFVFCIQSTLLSFNNVGK